MNFSDSFRTARWIRLINLLLQAVLFLTLFAGLNYVALNHSWRFDLTKNRRYSLSAETESYLKRLTQAVRIHVTFTDDPDNLEIAQAYRDLSGLLREYEYSTRGNPDPGRIRVEFIDVFQSRRAAEAAGVVDQPNVVVVSAGDRRRTIRIDELYHIKDKVRREAFRGESALTAALLDVTAAERKKIYFVLGHGETSPDDTSDRGLSRLRDELRQRNFDLGALDLQRTRSIPDDASALILAGQHSPVSRLEEELLRNYLQTRAGRLILMLDHGRAHGLENLLFDWGVIVYDNLILDESRDNLTDTGELILSAFLERHPATENLIRNGLAVLSGPARVVSDDLGRPPDDGLDVKVIVATSKTAWGESGYRLGNRRYTPGQDLGGGKHLGVLVFSERTKPANNLPTSVRGGRLAVFGTSDLATNSRLINTGNHSLILATINWATSDLDTQVNIPVRPIERFQLALSQDELARLRLGLLLIVPGAVALLGLLVYWTRRS